VDEVVVEPELAAWRDRFAARTRTGAGGDIAAIMAIAGRTDIISFAGGVPDPATFQPIVLADVLRDLAVAGEVNAFQYGPTEGLASTLEFLADRLAAVEGLRPEAGELIVTSGGIEALELLGKALLDPGDAVAVEAPTYLGAIMSFRSFEADVVALPFDDDGLEPDALEAELRRGLRPKFLYTIPDHQNPTGVTLAADRRPAVVELARRYGFLIVEDVAYRELVFDGDPAPSLWAAAPDTVLQIGTFSKTFMPGTRLGWACGPAEVVSNLIWAKQTTDQCASTLGQRLLEEFGRRGLLDEAIRRSQVFYARRCRTTLDALARLAPTGLEWTHPRGGFFTWLTLPPGADAGELADRAAAAGVAIVPGTPFFPDSRGGRNLRLSFSRVRDEEIEEGIARLAALVQSPAAA
jgi:2-aminoadipate transaminase